MTDDDYEAELARLQTALVDAQIWSQAEGKKVCIVFEGRDSAGKDGVIKRITEHLSVRQTRVMALPKPSDREKTQWWFQRYAAHLPAAGEWAIFNRSWYNRAGVEKVMGFSTPHEQEIFLRDVASFESMLADSDIVLIKFWLDISKDEQKERLDDRRSDPLKRLKVSPLDAVAQEKWDAYSAARDEMLRRSHHATGHWTCVKTDKKKKARLNTIRHVLHAIGCPDYTVSVETPDPEVVFSYDAVIEGKQALFK
ncbi:polyphosphate kinase 2 [Asticcacaulis sp. BYS171W]|uniref:ADP/GDP-polyphosphate phosphotransferase n=1 Tax=Asticcacaulis aquaticus TaxID=2984212 RepID=A0ABT5HZH7_9CAUL|nr:polyphosphate kinase 2 [Asticcacaulis aquaticus]MDC7685250.1 polyphosphate kinase 2 [Asticcacaulis aquaticus]